MISVSIIIPNWNGADLLKAYLPSVLSAKKNYQGNTEIIVVDDASTDPSVNLLKKEFLNIKIVIHEQNQGFGKACWSGAQAAKHPTLIFLNSDVKVDPDFIAPLMKNFKDPTVFSASPLILNQNGSPADVTVSMPYFRRGKIRYKPVPLQQLMNNTSSLPNPWYTLFPLGGAFAVDRKRFLKLHGFDDLFVPFYYEDTDLGFCAWRRGWKCIVVPESRVTHFHKGTISRSFNRFRIKIIRKRNRLLYLWKNLTSPELLKQQILFHLLRLFYSLFLLDGMSIVATVLAVPRFRKAMRKRRNEQKNVVNSEKKIFRIINSANRANCLSIESSAYPACGQILEGNENTQYRQQ